jgi:hypothetical protein
MVVASRGVIKRTLLGGRMNSTRRDCKPLSRVLRTRAEWLGAHQGCLGKRHDSFIGYLQGTANSSKWDWTCHLGPSGINRPG